MGRMKSHFASYINLSLEDRSMGLTQLIIGCHGRPFVLRAAVPRPNLHSTMSRPDVPNPIQSIPKNTDFLCHVTRHVFFTLRSPSLTATMTRDGNWATNTDDDDNTNGADSQPVL